jgi:hypothetical protein
MSSGLNIHAKVKCHAKNMYTTQEILYKMVINEFFACSMVFTYTSL